MLLSLYFFDNMKVIYSGTGARTTWWFEKGVRTGWQFERGVGTREKVRNYLSNKMMII